ncbi:MAG: MMPL family transporter, partial [Acidobacteriota bacterium]
MSSFPQPDKSLFHLAQRRPGWTLAVAAIALLGAIAPATRVRVESDVLSLMPSDNRVVGEFRDTLERFGSLDLMLVGLELQNGPEDKALAFADILAEELRALPEVDWLEYHADELLDAAVSLVRWAPLYMSEEDLEDLLETVATQEGIDLAVAELAESLRSPADLPFKNLRQVDPLGMLPRAWKNFGGGARGNELSRRFNSENGYVIDPGGRFILLLVQPADTAANVPFARHLLAEVDKAATRAEGSWHAERWEGEPPILRMAGGHVTTVHDARLILNDLTYGTPAAILAVVILFAVAFGRPVALAIAFVPLFVGLALTAAFAVVSLGRLNAVTATFAALLVGLGIDFVIVLYARYVEERRAGSSFEQAMAAMSEHTVQSVRLGAMTTAVTFFAFLISDFAGLWELGLLTGAGVIIVMIAVFAVLPAVLKITEKAGRAKPPRLRGFGSEQLMLWCHRNPRPILALNLVLTAALTFFALRVEYDDDALNLRSSKNPGLIAQKALMEAFGLRFTPYMVRIDGSDEADALRRAREVLPELQALVDGERLARVESVAAWVPDGDHQARQIEKLKAFRVAERPLRQQLEEALRGRGLRPEAFAEGAETLVDALSVKTLQGPSALADSTVGHLLGRYMALDEGRASTIIYCYPPPGKWRREPPPDLVQATGQYPFAVLTGPVIVSGELKAVVWRDAMLAGLLGAVLVTLFLARDLGGLKPAILSLVPLSLGIVWMLGGMALSGVPVNFLNIFVFTMILGIGVDYGIHLLHRWQESGDLQEATGLASAITVAALTTVCGFGSLVVSSFPGLRSMGAAAIFG